MKIALLVSNRGFFPSSVIESAYDDMQNALKKVNIDCLTIDKQSVKYGAVETTQDGFVFASFLREHRGEFDGLVICLPNFGDENGIKAAIAEVDVPILLQAYPDEIGKMDFEHRRDAFCGKFALTSVLTQMGTKYTAYTPFTVHPSSREFSEQLEKFAGVCRIVKRMKRMRLGAVGARTTAFKSVRYDECALERHGIDVEAYDLSSVFRQMKDFNDDSPQVREWLAVLHDAASFDKVPSGRDVKLARLGSVLDKMIKENALDAIAIRCWSELQQELGISPCAVMGLFNQKGIPAICETDVTNAIPMFGLSLAAGRSSGCLDINNNYGDDLDKCILFHCGPLPLDLMEAGGEIQGHKMLNKSFGEGCSWGLNVGKVKKGDVTYSGGRTADGDICYYVDTGTITGDPVEEAFFGISCVLQTDSMQRKLNAISRAGFRHHTVFTLGKVEDVVAETFTNYLGYKRYSLLDFKKPE